MLTSRTADNRKRTLLLGTSLAIAFAAAWSVMEMSGERWAIPSGAGSPVRSVLASANSMELPGAPRPLGEGSRASLPQDRRHLGNGVSNHDGALPGVVALRLLDESKRVLGGERVRLLVAGSGLRGRNRSVDELGVVDDAFAPSMGSSGKVGLAAWGGSGDGSSIAGWTGGDGHLEFTDVPTGTFLELVFEGPTRARATLSLAPLAPGERRTLTDCMVPEGAIVEGRVLDDAGAPIPGAWVTISRSQSAMQFLSDPSGSLGPLGIEEDRTQTDSKGGFRFDALLAGSLGVSARAPGFVDSRVHHIDVGADAVDPGPIELRLGVGGRVRGLVVDESGAPRSDARVALVPFLEGVRAHGEAPRVRDEVLARGIRTDASGAFDLGGFLEGRDSSLVIVGPGCAALAMAAPSPGEFTRIVLPKVCSIEGRVLDRGGTGVEAAEVLLESERPGDLIPWQRTLTSADGSFGLGGLSSGFHRLRVSSGRGTADLRVLVERPGEELQVELSEELRLRVRLRDGLHRELQGVAVRLAPSEATRRGSEVGSLGSRPVEVWSDSAGLACFAGVEPGRWRVEASLAGRASLAETVEIVPGGVVDLDWVLDEASILHLEVVAADGRAIPGAGVRLELADPGARASNLGSRFVRADDHGRCVFNDLQPGTWRVSSEEIRSTMHGLEAELTRVQGELASAMDLVLEAGGIQRERLTLELESALRVRVTQQGEPVVGAQVVLSQADHRADLLWRLATLEGGVTTDARGWASMPAVPPGEYILGARRHLRSPVTLERRHLGAGVAEIELALARGEVSGRVLSGPEEVLAHAQVHLIPINPLELGTVAMVAKRSGGRSDALPEHGAPGFTANLAQTVLRSSRDGGFAFREVPEGEYRVLCTVPGHRPFELEAPLRVPDGGSRDLGELILEPTCELTAEVVEGDDSPLQGAPRLVRLETPEGGLVALRRLGSDDRVQFLGIAPGPYRVVAQVGDRPPCAQHVDVHPERPGHTVLTLP